MLDISETFDFEKSRLYAEKLDVKYPFLTCTVIGRAYSGRGIFAFSFGNSSNAVVITGGTAGKYSQTSIILYRFINRVCRSILLGKELSGVNFSALTEKYGITVIPCLNPDSAEIAVRGIRGAGRLSDTVKKMPCGDYSEWKANGAGVDINLNFDTDWRMLKIKSLENNVLFSSGEGFPGEMKESEPETRAFSSYCRMKGFRSCLTLSEGNNLVYYSKKNKSPVSSAMMAKILASSCFCHASDAEIPPSPSAWFVSEFSKPGFLLEAQRGETSAEAYERLEEALVLMSVM